jgi:hypothetical protein
VWVYPQLALCTGLFCVGLASSCGLVWHMMHATYFNVTIHVEVAAAINVSEQKHVVVGHIYVDFFCFTVWSRRQVACTIW